MKKLIALTLTLIFALALTACGTAEKAVNSDVDNSPVETTATEPAIETVIVVETQNPSQTETLPQDVISQQEAIDIALKKAGLSENEIIGLWAELDHDDGILKYEVDFSDGKYDYDCDINAKTGKILSFEKELDD